MIDNFEKGLKPLQFFCYNQKIGHCDLDTDTTDLFKLSYIHLDMTDLHEKGQLFVTKLHWYYV